MYRTYRRHRRHYVVTVTVRILASRPESLLSSVLLVILLLLSTYLNTYYPLAPRVNQRDDPSPPSSRSPTVDEAMIVIYIFATLYKPNHTASNAPPACSDPRAQPQASKSRCLVLVQVGTIGSSRSCRRCTEYSYSSPPHGPY